MAYRLFEGKKHASIYQKYRFPPPEDLKDAIIQYLDTKKGPPHVLAVDLGCGTGQFTRLLAPHFKEVVGIDVSENQVEEARLVLGSPNITYRQGTAEDLPFEDGTVDLLTAASAAHWFDQVKFLAEVNRVLKPGGCIALLGFSETNLKFHYKDIGDKLDQIYQEVKQLLQPYTSSPVAISDSKLDAMYSAISFPDKERVENFPRKTLISVSKLMGFIRSWSMFQTFEMKDPQGAEDMINSIQKRILHEMGVTSPDTEIERDWEYFCVLASKPL
uniref:Methyltransferase type 11 domain-containing protein n=1 Tax=Nothobranchius rachovii TaxID=451742 RepID=A0A1A8SL37_9TELE